MKDYFENPAISRSDLVRLDTHPKVYKYPKESSGGDAFRLGSAFDHLMYFPDTWADEYHVSEHHKPTGFMAKLCLRYIELKDRDTWETEEEIFNAAYEASGYELSKKAVKARFEKGPKQFVDEMIAHGKKTFIGAAEAKMLDAMKKQLLDDPAIAKYFIPHEDTELHFQLPVYWDETVVIKGANIDVPVKVLFDAVLVDHKNKTIHPVDLKTTGDSVYKFPHSFKFYKYYLQASMYTSGLYHWKAEQGLTYYEVQPFRFIVAEKAVQNPSLIYKVSASDMVAGSAGYTNMYKQHVRGWKELLTDLTWHDRNDKWDHPRSVYEGGEVILHELH